MLSAQLFRLLNTLINCRCFVFPEPGACGFRRTIHDRYPSISLPLAPGYFDIRQLMSHPGAYRDVAEVMAAVWQRELTWVQRVSDIRDASTPLVAVLSEITGIPMISPRLSPKARGAPQAVDGAYRSGERAALIDDVVSEGAVSKRRALAILRNEGLEVVFIGVVLDNRLSSGKAVDGVPVHSLLQWHASFTVLRDAGHITDAVYEQCIAYPRQLADALREHGIEE